MTDAVDAQAGLEAVLKDEIVRMYQEVADDPDGEFHFFHGREAAELFGYPSEWLDRAPPGAVASFAGVGNPHERAEVQPGEVVLDLGIPPFVSKRRRMLRPAAPRWSATKAAWRTSRCRTPRSIS